MKKIILIVLFFDLLLFAFADAKGEEIAKKYFGLKKSDDCYSITTMVLINKNNEKKIVKMETFSKESKNGRNSFMKFFDPADVKGTTFLILGYKTGDDEQRLYLPDLGKVRKIATSNKDQKFMGSDLSYYDMEDHDYGDFTYKYIKDETYEGMDCSVIEMYPSDKNSPYSKELAWINKKDSFAYKIECYDNKKSSKIKTIVFVEVKDYNGVLIPLKIAVDNHRDNHKTLMQDGNIKINIGLSGNIFTIQNMTSLK